MWLLKQIFKPDGFLSFITPSPQPISKESKKAHINKLRDFFNDMILGFSNPCDIEEKKLYSFLLTNSSAIFLKKREYHLAIKNLQAAEGLIPYDVEVLNGLGAVYAEMGLLDKAEAYFKKALDILPSHISTLKNLGQIYLDTQNYNRAFPIFKKILKKEPNDLRALFNVGVCYEKTGNTEKKPANLLHKLLP
jgi:tetratricopeptide (TPR) repeat protein